MDSSDLAARALQLIQSIKAELEELLVDLRNFSPSNHDILPVSALAISEEEIQELAEWLESTGRGAMARRLLQHWGQFVVKGTSVLILAMDLDDHEQLETAIFAFSGAAVKFLDFSIDLESHLLAMQASISTKKSEDDDPIEDVLSGQPLKLYRFLKSRRHWTSYDSLMAESEFWQKPDPLDATINKALRRLQKELNSIEMSRIILEIHDKERRTKLTSLDK